MKYTDTLKKSSKKSLIDKISKRLLEVKQYNNNKGIKELLKKILPKL